MSAMANYRNISTARSELPSLFDRVTARDGERVTIRRRDGGPEAVLVSRGYLDRLELARPAPRTDRPFHLLGSGALLRPCVEVLDEIRAAAAAEAGKRLGELAPPAVAESRSRRGRRRPAR